MKERLGLYLAVALVGIGLFIPTYVWATFSLTTTGNVTVTTTQAPTLAQIISANVGGVSCSVAVDGLSASCPSSNLAVNGQENVSVSVTNTGTTTISPLVNVLSSNPSVASITQNFGNPTSIAGGGLGTYVFTITANAQGSTGYSVAISG